MRHQHHGRVFGGLQNGALRPRHRREQKNTKEQDGAARYQGVVHDHEPISLYLCFGDGPPPAVPPFCTAICRQNCGEDRQLAERLQ